MNWFKKILNIFFYFKRLIICLIGLILLTLLFVNYYYYYNFKNLTYNFKKATNTQNVYYFKNHIQLNDIQLAIDNINNNILISKLIFNLNYNYNLFLNPHYDLNIDLEDSKSVLLVFQNFDKFIQKINTLLKSSNIKLSNIYLNLHSLKINNFLNIYLSDYFKVDLSLKIKNYNEKYEILSINSNLNYKDITSEIIITKKCNSYNFNVRSLNNEILKQILNLKYLEIANQTLDFEFELFSNNLNDILKLNNLRGNINNLILKYLPLNLNFKYPNLNFEINDFKLNFNINLNDDVHKLSGFLNLKNNNFLIEGISNIDSSNLSIILLPFQNIITNYTLSGISKVFFKIEKINNYIDYFSEINLLGTFLQGDTGYPNINNLSGKIITSKNKLIFHEISGNIFSSKISLNGIYDLNNKNVDFDINLEDISISELKNINFKKFYPEKSELQFLKLKDGKINISIKINNNLTEINGKFSKLNLDLNINNNTFLLSNVSGKCSINKQEILIYDSNGFFNNIPFFLNAKINKLNFKDYVINFKIKNIDFLDFFSKNKINNQFSNFISNIQSYNNVDLNITISPNNNSIDVECKFNFNLPTISLFSILNINLENLIGKIIINLPFEKDILIKELNILIDNKINALLFINTIFPYLPIIVINGNINGKLTNDSKNNNLMGNFNFNNGLISLLNNLDFKLNINKLNVNTSIINNTVIINGETQILNGEINFNIQKKIKDDNFFIKCDGKNLDINEIYIQNNKISKDIVGLLNFQIQNNYKNDKNKYYGIVNIQNGILNLENLFNKNKIISKKNKYIFQNLNFEFILDDKNISILDLFIDKVKDEELPVIFQKFLSK